MNPEGLEEYEKFCEICCFSLEIEVPIIIY